MLCGAVGGVLLVPGSCRAEILRNYSHLAGSRAEAVAYTPHRLNIRLQAPMIRRLQLIPYLLYVHRYGGDIANGVHAPDAVENLILGENDIGMLGHEKEQ